MANWFTIIAFSCVSCFMSAPEVSQSPPNVIEVQTLSSDDILKAFVLASPKGIIAKPGTEIKLLDTLFVAELPDYDPFSDREAINMNWKLKGESVGAEIRDPQSWDAVLAVENQTKPRELHVVLELSRDNAKRQITIPIVVTR